MGCCDSKPSYTAASDDNPEFIDNQTLIEMTENFKERSIVEGNKFAQKELPTILKICKRKAMKGEDYVLFTYYYYDFKSHDNVKYARPALIAIKRLLEERDFKVTIITCACDDKPCKSVCSCYARSFEVKWVKTQKKKSGENVISTDCHAGMQN